MKRALSELIAKYKIGYAPTVQEKTTVWEALEALEKTDSGLVLVMRDENLVGVFSERDFARWALTRGHRPNLGTPIFDLIERKVIVVPPTYRLEECLALMRKHRVRHLPVMDQGRPVAVVSMRHIMEALIEDKQFLVEELTKYVTGTNFLPIDPPGRLTSPGGPPPNLGEAVA